MRKVLEKFIFSIKKKPQTLESDEAALLFRASRHKYICKNSCATRVVRISLGTCVRAVASPRLVVRVTFLHFRPWARFLRPRRADSACTLFHIYFRHSFPGFPLKTGLEHPRNHTPSYRDMCNACTRVAARRARRTLADTLCEK